MANKTDVYIDGQYVGFRTSDGKLYLQRCPKCGTENWSVVVAMGVCAWCGWMEEKKVETEKQ